MPSFPAEVCGAAPAIGLIIPRRKGRIRTVFLGNVSFTYRLIKTRTSKNVRSSNSLHADTETVSLWNYTRVCQC